MEPNSDVRALAQKIGFDPEYLAAFEDKLFIQGPETARRLTNFFVLLLLATVIATYGVISDSTATVIGAMIVAPLMGPIMATAAGVVMGSLRRTLRSMALVVAGVIAVILLSASLTFIVPDVVISFQENGEIASRISPGLTALLTALAAGAAGAYITSRKEIADSMGGVAIAISLVPPLCVTGIGINQGQWGAAGGAFMLFLTNFLAILLAGGMTFMLGGLGRLAITNQHQRMRRNAFALVTLATLLVAIPLSVTTFQVVDRALENRAATADVNRWLEGTNHELVRLTVNGQSVIAVIEGGGDLPPLGDLANQLSVTLKRPVLMDLRTIPSVVAMSNIETE